MKTIGLSGKNGIGKFVLVDDADFEYLSQHRWCFQHGYAVRYERVGLRKLDKKRRIVMHRIINKTPEGTYTDHINKNKLDNQRENLRDSTIAQNTMNTLLKNNNTSGFRGVFWYPRDKKWEAKIGIKKKHLSLGRFDTREEAAIVYNKKARELFGEFYCTQLC